MDIYDLLFINNYQCQSPVSAKLKNWFAELSLIEEGNFSYTNKNNKIKSITDLNYTIITNEEATTISAIMIIKNEERCINRCLENIKPLFDEVIIADTGSTDRTLEIIKQHTDGNIKLFHTRWENSFSKARNFASSKATKKWLFHIDADEILQEKNLNLLKKLLRKIELFNLQEKLAFCPKIIDHNNHKAIGVPRCFFNNKKFHYAGYVHEELRNEQHNFHSIPLDIKIRHDGYQKEIIEAKNKATRNISLLKENIKSEPNELRWKYFYCRDGMGNLDEEEIKKVIFESLFLVPENGLTSQNIKESSFTSGFLTLIAEIFLKEEDFISLEKVASIMNKKQTDKSNYLYYSALSIIMRKRDCLKSKLHELTNYRKNDNTPHYGMLHSEGYHIDIAILLLLRECGLKDKAEKFCNALKKDIPDINKIIATY